MTLDEIIKLMPPILLGFGAVVPVLIFWSKSVFADAPKAVLYPTLILIPWIAHFAAAMCWQTLLFNDWITLGLLILTAGLLLWVLLGPLLKDQCNAPDAFGRQNLQPTSLRLRQLFRWLLNMLRSKVACSIVYIAALTSVSIAAALYVAPKGRVIVDLEGPSNVQNVEAILQKQINPLPVAHKQRANIVKIVLTEIEFADATRFIVYTQSSSLWIAEQSSARAVISPGLGGRYVISAYQAK